MSSVVEKLAASGHLTPQQVERIGDTVSELVKEARKNPALLRAYIEKTGGGLSDFGSKVWGNMSEAAPAIVGGAIATGAMAAGTGLLEKAYDAIKGSVMKARNYKDMMDKNPQLSNYNAETVQAAFDTLHRFNPEYANDPLVAGTFVRNAAEAERVDVQQIHNLLQARERMYNIESKRRVIDPQAMVSNPIWSVGKSAPKGGDSQNRQNVSALDMQRAKLQAQQEMKQQSQQSSYQSALDRAHAAFKR